ncbi:MAG: hypothetical protein O4965_14590 [Trichodesmium sp. St19_bin1]|nr:hypothetical protein [Trichodesmium sp. St19_bin1]
MHATSLQGFGYGDVVHQFEKRCNRKKSSNSSSYHGLTCKLNGRYSNHLR